MEDDAGSNPAAGTKHMNYWRQVDIGDHELIAKKVHAHASTKVNLMTCPFWNLLKIPELREAAPELFSGVESLGETIRCAALLVLRIDDSTLHIDHTVGTQKGVQARLNLPILNTEGTTTAFFKMSDRQFGLSHVNSINGTRVWNFRHLYKPITTVAVTQPTVLRISAPHTVFCETNKFPRLTLTITFENDAVSWLQ